MKVIIRDNYARENHSEYLHKGGLTEEEARRIVQEHNHALAENDYGYCPDYFVAVDDDYELYKWEP